MFSLLPSRISSVANRRFVRKSLSVRIATRFRDDSSVGLRTTRARIRRPYGAAQWPAASVRGDLEFPAPSPVVPTAREGIKNAFSPTFLFFSHRSANDVNPIFVQSVQRHALTRRRRVRRTLENSVPTAVSARALARSETTVGVRVAPGRAPRTDYTSSSSRHVRLSCVISRGKRSRARVPYPSTRSRPVPPGSGRIMKRCCVAMAARECIAHALHRRKLYRPHGASLDTPLKLRVVCAVQMSRPVAEVCVLLNVIRAGRKSGAYVLQYETPHPPPVLLVVVRPGELYEPAVEGGGGRLCLLNSRPRIT